MVALRGVTTYFETFWGWHLSRVLQEVSFEVHQGEVFGIVGPVGAGKTSALKVIAGYISPTLGVVRVFSKSPRRARVRARIGYVPDPFDPCSKSRNLRVRSASLQGAARPAEARPAEIKKFHNDLARVLVKNPDLILLDEPFSSLDSIGFREMADIILTVARAGKTVILSSQRLSDVKDICARFAVLHRGNVEAVGTLEELLGLPEAVRFLAPHLPAQASDLQFQIAREALIAASPSMQTQESKSGQKSLSTKESMINGPKESDSVDRVDHERLAELMRPNP